MHILTSSKCVKLVDFNSLETVAEQARILDAPPDSIDVDFMCNKQLYCCYSNSDILRFYRIKSLNLKRKKIIPSISDSILKRRKMLNDLLYFS